MEEEKKPGNAPLPNPQQHASTLSNLTFRWTEEIFKKGSEKELGVDDLYAPLEEHKSDCLGSLLEKNWKDEIKKASNDKKRPSILKAWIKTFGTKMMILGVLQWVSDAGFSIAQPILLAWMLHYFSPGSTMTKAEAWLCAAGVVACSGFSALISNPVYLSLLHLAQKSRIACSSLIYRKTLRLSRPALAKLTSGQVLSLMATDMNRFEVGFVTIHYLWMGPITCAGVAYFLWRQVGVAGLIGMGALVASTPLQIWIGSKISTYRAITAKLTDERVGFMNEIIKGISVIKVQTWENAFKNTVIDIRRQEIKEMKKRGNIYGTMQSYILFNNRLAIFCTVVAHALMGHVVTATMAYLVTAYFKTLRRVMSDGVPSAISSAAELMASFKRIEEFLLSDERNSNVQTTDESGKISFVHESTMVKNPSELNELIIQNKFKNDVVLDNVSAQWKINSNEKTLENINLQFKTGSLSIIAGPVGSGKSSLLQVVLMELPVSRGSLQVFGSMSYAAQEPWLFEASVRQNILFGSPYNESRYRTVVRACALLTDFQQLPQGDRTWVGERGVILSGGQRARINLARAVYRDADIYVLDDPLSAVDAQVGKHLFEECILGLLADRTVILATHQLQFLSSADYIVFLDKGNIKMQGSFQELRSSNTDYLKFIKGVKDDNYRVTTEKRMRWSSGAMFEEYKPMESTPEVGSDAVSGRVFYSYLSADRHWMSMVLLVLLFCLTQIAACGGDYWLNHWVNLEEYVFFPHPGATSDTPTFLLYVSRDACIYIFLILIIATVVIALLRAFYFVHICMGSALNIHESMLTSILRAVMSFFHKNPSGRILNRFSKDLGIVDLLLPQALLDTLQVTLVVTGIIVLVVIIVPILIIPTIAVICIFYSLRRYYLKTSSSIKKLEGTTKSPMLDHLSSSLQGLATVRAFNAEHILEKEFDSHQDLNSSASYILAATNRAFGLWMDLVCFLYIGVVTFSFLVIDNAWLAGNVGLVITQTIGFIGMLQYGMKQSAFLEIYMASLARVIQYTELEEEPPLDSNIDCKPCCEWPTKGKIELKEVNLTYDKSLPLVLKNLSFTIRPKEKIGVVGRTGAGKSSLTAALFRLTPVQGKILIDDIDVATIGLHDLRSKVSFIPQEPVSFSGTVRHNLDPSNIYSDHQLWNALEEVELKDVVQAMAGGLDGVITEGGSNLSVGQRQLMCLARAVIQNNKIIILDEATANVDPETDALIQSTMRRRFAECTVLTIAHRLVTVIDSDRIMVISQGSVVEFDHPHTLLTDSNGYFHKMVQQLGNSMAQSLHEVAAAKYNQKFRVESYEEQ